MSDRPLRTIDKSLFAKITVAIATEEPMKQVMWCIALVVVGFNANVLADDRQTYYTRSAERYVAMFRKNDVDADNVVSRHEARTTIELAARFDDIDINRDGYITWVELTRYIDVNFR